MPRQIPNCQTTKKDVYKRQPIQYQIGEQILLKNRGLPSTMEGIANKLLLLYTGPYIVSKDNQNNTYEIVDPKTQRIKGTFNQTSMKKYY